MMSRIVCAPLPLVLICSAITVAAQTAPPPVGGVRPPAPPHLAPNQVLQGIPSDMTRSLEAQRAAWEVYQACVRANGQAVKLSSLSRTLVEMRDGKERYLALLTDPAASARAGGKSYDALVADGMAEYRRLGGSAASIGDVTVTPNPCQDKQPGARPASERITVQGGSPVSVKVSAPPSRVPEPPQGVPARDAAGTGGGPVADAPVSQRSLAAPRTAAPRPSRATQDARECLSLNDPKAIMACAEKYK